MSIYFFQGSVLIIFLNPVCKDIGHRIAKIGINLKKS